MATHRLASLGGALVEPAELLDRPNANRLFIDCRLGDAADELKSHRDAHIQGAVHAQIRDVFAGLPTARSGSLPLPAIGDLERRLRGWGVDRETELVVHGPSPALAARGWWVLRWAGLENAKVLDGGLKAWAAQGGPLAQGDFQPPRRPSSGGLTLSGGHLPSVSVDEVEALGPSTVLIDARDEGAFLAGAIPHAVNLPSAEQWTPSSALRTVDEIRARYAPTGALAGGDVVAYCGGGVLSALTVLTLSQLGLRPRLFVGSWSEWSKDPARMARSAAERAPA